MSKREKNSSKLIFGILVVFSILAAIKLILVDYTMDEEYQIVMAYRNLRGDAIFGEMWEPHQTSAFICIAVMYLYHLVSGTYTGIVIFLRVVTEAVRAGLSLWIYRAFGKHMEKREAFLLALLYFNSVPKLIDIPEFSNMQLWFFTIMALSLMEFYHGSRAGRSGRSSSVIWLVISSCALALEILSYPSCIILFPVTLIYIAYRSGENRIRDILIYILSDAACAGVWLAVVCRRIGLETLIRNARYTVEFDLTHVMSGSTDGKLTGSIRFLAQAALMLFIIAVISFIIYKIAGRHITGGHGSDTEKTIVAGNDNSQKNNTEKNNTEKNDSKKNNAEKNNSGKYLYAVIAILVSCVMQLVFWIILRKGYEYPQIHLLTILITAGILLIADFRNSHDDHAGNTDRIDRHSGSINSTDRVDRHSGSINSTDHVDRHSGSINSTDRIDRHPESINAANDTDSHQAHGDLIRPYMYGLVGSVISILAVFYISDLQFFNALPHGMYGILAALAVMAVLIRKACGDTGRKLIYILFLGVVITAMIGKGGSVKGGRELQSPLDVRGIMKHGPAVGILSDYMCCYIYNSDHEDFKANVRDGENVLIVTNMVFAPGTTPYMFGEYEVCHFSTVDPTSYDERLLTYWELYPEKRPDVIVVDCWYGQLMEDPDNWIMQYIENDFGYTSCTDGKYVRFYRR